MENKNVVFLNHPLIQHKISMLRDEKTGTNEFRKLVEEIAVLMGYEAFWKKACCCSDSSRRTWNDERNADSCSFRKSRTHWFEPQ